MEESVIKDCLDIWGFPSDLMDTVSKNKYINIFKPLEYRDILNSFTCMLESFEDQDQLRWHAKEAKLENKLNVLRSDWGSDQAEDALNKLSDSIAHIIARACKLELEFPDFRGYEYITSEYGKEPSGYELKPSITAFPFYKLQDRRPYWSVFQYGRQKELSVVMNPTTARSLLGNECPPGLHEMDAVTFKRELQDAVKRSLDNISKYQRNMFLHLGRGYAAYEVISKLLERSGFEPLMVDLEIAVEEPRPRKRLVEEVDKLLELLDRKRGTRLALVSDPGEDVIHNFISNKDYLEKYCIFTIRHDIPVQVGVGFSLGMLRFFIEHNNIIRLISEQIYEFFKCEHDYEKNINLIRSRGIDINESTICQLRNMPNNPIPAPTVNRAASALAGDHVGGTNPAPTGPFVAHADRSATLPQVAERSVVITLHGIKTHGKWQKDIDTVLAAAGFTPAPLDYGNFLAIQLLLPWSRRKKVDWFRDELHRVCKQERVKRPSIVAHSFGTYLVARAMQIYDPVEFDRVIFCGAIVRRDYSWSERIHKNQVAPF